MISPGGMARQEPNGLCSRQSKCRLKFETHADEEIPALLQAGLGVLRISHLTEQMQIGSADGQHLLAALQVDTSGLVFIAADVAD